MSDSSADEAMRFYFDFLSHNAYIAWTQIHALADRYGRSVEPVPVLFAGLLDAHGLVGPAEVRAKVTWMTRNTLRKAAVLGIALNPPASHPFNPLLALRVASLPLDTGPHRALVSRLFQAVWRDSRDVSDPQTVVRVLSEMGLDGEAMVRRCAERDVKERLRQQTAAAVAAGVFGVPTVVVDGELFWGYDDFPFLELKLSGRDPLREGLLADWARVQPSAQRRR